MAALVCCAAEAARSQPRSDQRLVAAHRRFDQRPFAIICCFLPCQSSGAPAFIFEMLITLCEWIFFTTEYRSVERGGITTAISSPCAAIVA